jgi:membrane protein DedA with SNARE-associated domain
MTVITPHMSFSEFMWGVVFIGGVVSPIIKFIIGRLWHWVFIRTEKELLIWEHYLIKRFKKKNGLGEYQD